MFILIGKSYYSARAFDPELGRFITPDTIVPDPSNPQAFNRYGYANNNPIRYTDPTGHSWWDKVKEKVLKAFAAEVLVFAAAIIISMVGGPPAFTITTLIAATAAAATTLTLDTGEGRQLIDRVGHEFFDDVLGMRPKTAHTWSSVVTHMGVGMAYNVALSAMILNPNLQSPTDRSQNETGPEGRSESAKKQVDSITKNNTTSAAKKTASPTPESSTAQAPGKIPTQNIGEGKQNYDFSANSGDKQVFDMAKSLNVEQTPSPDKFTPGRAKKQWQQWRTFIDEYNKRTREAIGSNSPFEDGLQMPCPTHAYRKTYFDFILGK